MLYALHSKCAIEIADAFSLFVHHFNILNILQIDNGREFKRALLIFLKQHGIKLINGRPHSSQTQGLVEQSNEVVKDKIHKWQEENRFSEWAITLTEVIIAMNRQHHQSLNYNMSLYKVMYG